MTGCPHNKALYEEIMQLALRMDFVKDNLGDPMRPGVFKSDTHKKRAKNIVRNQFKAKQDNLKKQGFSEERRSRTSLGQKMNARKNRKLERRVKEFNRLPEGFPIALDDGDRVTKAECTPLLVKEAMSDEEDLEMVRGNVAKTLKVKRPSWRSNKANKLFEHLDDLHVSRRRQYCQEKERAAVEEVEVELPAALRRSFPPWAVRQEQ